jgi:1,4-dihydroxy-6-naphthoate synthase
MKLTLGFSPCPNDTFIFDALVNKKIDTGDLEFEVFLEDVQTLNEWALQGKLDVSKISYGVLPLVMNKYTLLNSGGALGKGVGPLLISKKEVTGDSPGERIGQLYKDGKPPVIAIPGKHTTAHILFSKACLHLTNKVFKVFNEIEDAVLSGEVDAGVIIHENRFTYQTRGLHKVMDLGEFWEKTTHSPIPLGGIVARDTLPAALVNRIDNLINQSLQYAYKHHHIRLSDYVKQHAQEMSESVMRQHIDLYVNNFSLDLGAEGRKAVQKFLDIYRFLNTEEQRTYN